MSSPKPVRRAMSISAPPPLPLDPVASARAARLRRYGLPMSAEDRARHEGARRAATVKGKCAACGARGAARARAVGTSANWGEPPEWQHWCEPCLARDAEAFAALVARGRG